MKNLYTKFLIPQLVILFSFLLLASFVWAAGDSINVNLSVTGGTVTTCTNPSATNFGGTLPCTFSGGTTPNSDVYGCMDSKATNYNSTATKDNGTCQYPPEVRGCIDRSADNYNPAATKDDGSCTYPPELMGCMDKTALNYDPKAKKDDGSCSYKVEVPNAYNFLADFNKTEKKIYLTWNNPNFTKFKSVRVLRSTFGIPANPQDGAVVYEGRGVSAIDPAVEYNTRYYYTIFVESTDSEFSSGAVVSAISDEPVIEPPKCVGSECEYKCVGENCDTNPPPAGGVPNDPFSNLPTASTTDPVLVKLSVGDFVLRQSGELSKYFGTGAIVKIQGNKNTIFEIDKNSMPAVLKTIGVVISDPKNVRRSFSFILHDNGTGKYTATLAPFWRNGIFPVTIYIVNYQDQTVKKITGRLQVAGVSFIDNSAVVAATQKYVDPALTALGLGAGLSQALLIGSNVNSFYDFVLLIMRLGYSFLSWLGIRRKRPEWGTVYDAVTKQPIDPAYVTVQNVAGKEVTSAITDIDGRFGFLLPKDVYYIKVGKTNYLFPSQKLNGQTQDELYDNLYFGTPLAHDGNQIIKLNVPLDPINFDWNEFAKSQIDFFKIYTKKETLRRRILAGVFYSGFALSLFKTIVAPSALDFSLLVIYIGVLIYQRFKVTSHKIVSVKKADGSPLMFALVRLYLPGIDQPIKSATTDQLGRLYVLVRPGTYYYTVEEKMSDGSYKKIYQSGNINMPKGVLDNDIVV